MGVEITNASKCHPELVSGSHCEPILMLHRGQMLKRVQHDHQLWSFVFCDIEEHKKQVIEWSQTSRLITHNSQLKNMFFCSSVKKMNLRAIVHICQNTRKRDFGNGRRKDTFIQQPHNQVVIETQKYIQKHTKKRLQCFLSFT